LHFLRLFLYLSENHLLTCPKAFETFANLTLEAYIIKYLNYQI
jgi:N-dimethylarginine dimethylaminohydrolase